MAQKLSFAENFALSGCAAVISKTAAAPIERIKLLIQNQDEMIKQGKLDVPYKGIGECATRTMKNEGALSFWRGNLANCIRYFPTQALNFAFKDKIKALFATPKTAPQWQKFGSNILSGGAAGTLSLLFVYSLDFARTKLANDAKAVTVAASSASYPIDTIRRRMMMTSGTGVHYKNWVDCGAQIMKNEGVTSFFKGNGANILRGIAGAGVLSGFDLVKKNYIAWRTSQ